MSQDFRALNARMGTVARIAAVLALIGAIVFLFSLRGLGKALTTPSAEKSKKIADEQNKKVAADYALAMEGQVKQFNGRSVFFIPSAPIPPAPPEVIKPVEVAKEPEKPQPPKTYLGPKIIAMVNGAAWFDDGKKMAEGDPIKDKLLIKKIKAPWGATVEWDGVEFEVPLFASDSVVYPPPKKEEPKAAATEAAKDPLKEPAKETPVTDIKAGDKPDSPKPEAEPKPADPKPDTTKPDTTKPDQPEAPKPELPKTDKPDSPGSPEGQIEKNE